MIKTMFDTRYQKIKAGFCRYFYQDGLQLNRIFIVLLLFGDIIFWLMQMIVHGEWMDGYFLDNSHDTGMDYFNMLACLDKHNPYKMQVNYPPMCFLILKFMYRFVPTSLRGEDANGFYYRELMHAQIIYVLCMFVISFCIFELVKYSYIGSDRDKKLFACGVLLSGPFLFTLERGNLIIVSFVCLLIFINFYDSEKRWKRWCAYLALSFSAAIKIYPAFFGILIIYRKRYKEAIQTVIVGLIIFVAPCLIFGGMEIFQRMFLGMSAATDLQKAYGMGSNFSFSNLIKIVGAVGGNVIELNNVIRLIIPLIVCCIVYICSKEEWKKIYSIALMCIWIPDFSYTYTLLLFVLPLISFLRTHKESNYFIYLYGLLFIIILIPLCLPKMGYLEPTTDVVMLSLTMSTLIENVAIGVLTISILLEDIVNIIKKNKKCEVI